MGGNRAHWHTFIATMALTVPRGRVRLLSPYCKMGKLRTQSHKAGTQGDAVGSILPNSGETGLYQLLVIGS